MPHRSRKVVAFIHSYMPDGRLDPFMDSLVHGFIRCGIDLYLIIANNLVFSLGSHTYAPHISATKVDSYVRSIKPDLIFSSNRAGICQSLIDNPPCPIVTWFVDLIPFMHHGGTAQTLFGKSDYVVTPVSKSIPVIERDYSELKGRVHYLPFATEISRFKEDAPFEKDIPILFVGTLFYSVSLRSLYHAFLLEPHLYPKFIRMLEAFQAGYESDEDKIIDDLGIRAILKKYGYHPSDIKMATMNAISTNHRVAVLSAVADLGLHLYGTENWVDVLPFSLELFMCFHACDKIDDRSKLIDLYQRSKISINISHQQAMGAMPYRMYDILASDSMLLAGEETRNDLEALFDGKSPVPIYRNPSHARELAAYYLAHDDERRAIVAICNARMQEGFDFTDRVREIFSFISTPLEFCEFYGTHVDVDTSLFVRSGGSFFWRLYESIPLKKRLAIVGVFKKILPSRLKQSLKKALGTVDN